MSIALHLEYDALILNRMVSCERKEGRKTEFFNAEIVRTLNEICAAGFPAPVKCCSELASQLDDNLCENKGAYHEANYHAYLFVFDAQYRPGSDVVVPEAVGAVLMIDYASTGWRYLEEWFTDMADLTAFWDDTLEAESE